MTVGVPALTKWSRLVPNIPTHDTWLRSRIFCSFTLWIFVPACLTRWTIRRGSFRVRIKYRT